MFDFIIRTKNGLLLLKHSFTIFIKNKQLILLSLLHALMLFIVINTVLFSFQYRYHTAFLQEKNIYSLGFGPILAVIITWLVLYFSTKIIDLFFAVATSRSYLQKLQNKSESLNATLKKTYSKLRIIIEWATTWSNFSLYRSSKPVEHCETDLKKDSKSAIRAIENILEFSWETSNLLVPPIMAAENISVTTLAKHENAYLKEAFGEKIAVMFNFRAITLLSFILCIIVYIFALSNHTKLPMSKIPFVALGLYAAIYIVCLIGSLKTIYKTLIYAHIKHIITVNKLLIDKSLVPLNR